MNKRFNKLIENQSQAYRGLTGGFLLLQISSVAISVTPHDCFTLDLILISYELGIFHANQQLSVRGTKAKLRARVGRPQTSSRPLVISLLAVPRSFFGDFRFGVLLFMVILAI